MYMIAKAGASKYFQTTRIKHYAFDHFDLLLLFMCIKRETT